MENAPRWLREKVELSDAMSEAPSRPHGTKADMVPAAELMGVYIAYATVSRLAHEGKISLAAAAYFNGALGCLTFSIIHHCTHESLSQANEEFEAMENCVFRLGSLLIFFNDGYREAHRAHHAAANEDDDPDHFIAEAPLPVLGQMLHIISRKKVYLHIGVPIPSAVLPLLYKLGLIDYVASSWFDFLRINWDNQTTKMFSFAALDVVKDKHPELFRTILATWWSGAVNITTILLALFFARYPHRNAKDPTKPCPNRGEEWSFYDTTFRGDSAVEMWMMGEGAHHMHHAQSDVGYSWLTQVCREVEAARPDIRDASRFIPKDIRDIEYSTEMPPTHKEVKGRLKANLTSAPRKQPPVIQKSGVPKHAERTDKVVAALSNHIFDTSPTRNPTLGLVNVTEAVVDSALHTCHAADRSLLHQILGDLFETPPKEYEPNHPLPAHTMAETVFSDATEAELHSASQLLKGEIKITAQKVGAKVFGEAGSKPPLDAISFGDQLFDTVVALAEVVIEQSSISNESLGAFWTSLGSHFGRAPSEEAVAAKEAWLGAKRQREQSDGDDSALLALREKQTKEWYLALRKRDQASENSNDHDFHRDAVLCKVKKYLYSPLPSDTKRTSYSPAGKKRYTQRRLADMLFAQPSRGKSRSRL